MSSEKLPKTEALQFDQAIDLVMAERFARYSKYIIQNRALPDVRDGLKPVQRRILYAMHELGLLPSSAYKKSARVVGEVIGKYHPHGDSSIYEALVRMAQEWKLLVPLVDMHGNKGSLDDDPAAAMRYTETRLASASLSMLSNLEKAVVSFAPNFDDSEREPVVLPALFPNLLVNGAKGIAAGYATEMPPHNLNEIVDAIIFKIKSPQARLSSLLEIVKGPDFPTGGIVQGREGIVRAFEGGQGKILIRSRYEVKKDKTNTRIIITEIPYGVIKQKLVRDIDVIRFEKKVPGIKEVRDETSREGVSIVIELAPGASSELVINYLLQKTELQIYYHYNNIVINKNAPQLMGLSALIDAYLAHQKDVQVKALTFDLNKAKTRFEVVQGFIKVSEIPDQIVEVIRNTVGARKEVVQALVSAFQFTQLQAEAIADLRLYRLSKTDRAAYLAEAEALTREIARLTELLSVPESFNKYLIELLRELKKHYGTPRLTSVENDIAKIEIDREALIPREPMQLAVSSDGLIRRYGARSEATLEDLPLRDGDLWVYQAKVNTKDKLVLFTTLGRALTYELHQLAEAKGSKDIGLALSEIMPLAPRERLLSVFVVSNFALPLSFVLASASGSIKRVALSDFEANKPLRISQVMPLSENDFLVSAWAAPLHCDIVTLSSTGRLSRYNEKDVPLLSFKAQGVQAQAGLKAPVTLFGAAPMAKHEVLVALGATGTFKAFKASEVALGTRSGAPRGQLLLKGDEPLALYAIGETELISYLTASNKVSFKPRAELSITPISTGLRAIAPLVQRTSIINHAYLDEAWVKTHAVTKESAAARFAAAEAKLAAASQISLDDLLEKGK